MTKTKSNLPWMTRSIKRQMSKRDKLHSLARHSPQIHQLKLIKAAYRKQRNKVVSLLRSPHVVYLCKEIGESLETNPKRFWSYVKHYKSESGDIPTLQLDSNLYISCKEKAQTLNDQFESGFIRDNGALPDIGSLDCPGI